MRRYTMNSDEHADVFEAVDFEVGEGRALLSGQVTDRVHRQGAGRQQADPACGS